MLRATFSFLWPALVLAALALSLYWLLIGCPSGQGAPAPLPRPARPAVTVLALTVRDLQGNWRMTWGGGEWNVCLDADGNCITWRGVMAASVWVGTWQLNNDSSITVSEAWLEDDGRRGSEMTWTAVWKRDERGRLNPRHLRGKVRRPDGSTATTVVLRRK